MQKSQIVQRPGHIAVERLGAFLGKTSVYFQCLTKLLLCFIETLSLIMQKSQIVQRCGHIAVEGLWVFLGKTTTYIQCLTKLLLRLVEALDFIV